MTKHDPIEQLGPVEQAIAQRKAARAAFTRALKAACETVEAEPDGQIIAGEVLCGMLDTIGGGAPRYDAFGDMREDARFWADCATPMELELYAAAALRRIERTTFAERARKRLFWALWQGMSEKDRAAFLGRVTAREGAENGQ